MRACQKSVLCAAVALLSLLPAASVSGQSDSAGLIVTVIDASGAGVPGASVSVRHAGTALARHSVSDNQGRATFALLAPGLYDVLVELSGFVLVRETGVRLSVAQTGQLRARLDVAGFDEAVDVRAAVTALNLTNAAHGTLIGEEEVQALPLNSRQFIQLALLVPGANSGGRAVQQNVVRQNQIGGLSIAGGRTNNTAFLLDGAVNTDPDYNSLSLSPSIDAIAEFQVQTAQFTAEYGRAGGQVNVITKSGDNTLRGSVFEYHRHKRFDAKPFNLVGDLPQFRRDNFGGSLGGPIARDRVFFFAAYERRRDRPSQFSARAEILDEHQYVSCRPTAIIERAAGDGIPIRLLASGRPHFPRLGRSRRHCVRRLRPASDARAELVCHSGPVDGVPLLPCTVRRSLAFHRPSPKEATLPVVPARLPGCLWRSLCGSWSASIASN